jgi:hypothetical protein
MPALMAKPARTGGRHSIVVQWSELLLPLLTAFAESSCDPATKQECIVNSHRILLRSEA